MVCCSLAILLHFCLGLKFGMQTYIFPLLLFTVKVFPHSKFSKPIGQFTSTFLLTYHFTSILLPFSAPKHLLYLLSFSRWLVYLPLQLLMKCRRWSANEFLIAYLTRVVQAIIWRAGRAQHTELRFLRLLSFTTVIPWPGCDFTDYSGDQLDCS